MKYLIAALISIFIFTSSGFAYTRIFYEDCEDIVYADHFLEDQYGSSVLAYWNELIAEISQSNIQYRGTYSMTYDPWVTENPHANVGLGNITYGNLSNFDLSANNGRYWYFRWYQRWESGQSYSGENKLIYINYQTAQDFTFTFKKTSGTGFHLTLKDYDTYSIQDPASTYNPWPTHSGGSLDDDEWHKIEFYIDVGTTGGNNGQYWIKIDDIELINNTGVIFNGTIHSNPITYLTGWPSNVSSATGTQDTWLDDLEIYLLSDGSDIPPELDADATATVTGVSINQ